MIWRVLYRLKSMAHVDCCDPTAPPRQFPLPTTNPLPISTSRHGRKSSGRKITLLCRKRDKNKKYSQRSYRPLVHCNYLQHNDNLTQSHRSLEHCHRTRNGRQPATTHKKVPPVNRRIKQSTAVCNIMPFPSNPIKTSTNLYHKRNGTISTRRKTTLLRSGTKSKKYS